MPSGKLARRHRDRAAKRKHPLLRIDDLSPRLNIQTRRLAMPSSANRLLRHAELSITYFYLGVLPCCYSQIPQGGIILSMIQGCLAEVRKANIDSSRQAYISRATRKIMMPHKATPAGSANTNPRAGLGGRADVIICSSAGFSTRSAGELHLCNGSASVTSRRCPPREAIGRTAMSPDISAAWSTLRSMPIP